MPSEFSAAIWIPIAALAFAGLVAAVWYGFGRHVEKSEEKIAKDLERVEKHTKEEIARVDRRIDGVAADQVKLHERTAVAERDIQRAQEDIGDHGTGLRGWLHSIANAVNPVVSWFGLRDRWKDDK